MLKNNTNKNRCLQDICFRHDENQYLNLIDDIIKNGYIEEGRNGKTKSVFGASMHFSLANNKIPLLTTKKIAWKTCLKELIWFIDGSTDNEILQKQNVKIWNANSTRQFLDNRGLDYSENDLGPVYGHQWRHFNAEYVNCKTHYKGKGVDQLENVIRQLKDKDNLTSRRIIMSAWNPCQVEEMALPPCHILCQFNVYGGNKLSCSMYQRSGDIGLGVPFNIASYSFLTHILAHHCGLVAEEFVYFLGNAHIYDDHILQLEQQITRIPKEFPTIHFLETPEKIEGYNINNIKINEYEHHPQLLMNIRQ